MVAIKSESQQAILALHRIRAQLMKFRIMQTNALRGLLYELAKFFQKAIGNFLKESLARLPAPAVTSANSVSARMMANRLDRGEENPIGNVSHSAR